MNEANQVQISVFIDIPISAAHSEHNYWDLYAHETPKWRIAPFRKQSDSSEVKKKKKKEQLSRFNLHNYDVDQQ